MARRYFTLIELLVVIFLLGAMGSIIAINAPHAIRHQQFTVSVQTIRDKLEGAQLLALYQGADVEVHIENNEQNPQEAICFITTTATLTPLAKKTLRAKHPLKSISQITYKNECYSILKGFAPLIFYFNGSGLPPQETIILENSDYGLTAKLPLSPLSGNL